MLQACTGTPSPTARSSETEPPEGETQEPAVTESPTRIPGAPDLTGETITLYFIGDISGPYAALTGPLVNGANDYVAWLNDNEGIFGADLAIEFSDTAGSAEVAVSSFETILTEDENPLLLIVFGSAEEAALTPLAEENQIPMLAAGLDAPALNASESSYTFNQVPAPAQQFAFFLDYLLENWLTLKPVGTSEEINLAYISWPDAFGQSALTTESRAYAENLGVNIVYEGTFEMSPIVSTTTPVLNAQIAGANVIYTNTLAHGPAALLNDLNAIALREQFVVATNSWGLDAGTFFFLGDPRYADGVYAPFPFAWWSDAENSGIQFAEQLFQTNQRTPSERNQGRLLIQAALDVARHVVEQAILEEGYPRLDAAAVHQALTELGDYPVLGGLMTLDYTDGRRAPDSLQMRRVDSGTQVFTLLLDFAPAPELQP